MAKGTKMPWWAVVSLILLLSGGVAGAGDTAQASAEKPAARKYRVARGAKSLGSFTKAQLIEGLEAGWLGDWYNLWSPAKKKWVRLGCLPLGVNIRRGSMYRTAERFSMHCPSFEYREPKKPPPPSRWAIPVPLNSFTLNPIGIASQGWMAEGLRVSYQRQLHRLFSVGLSLTGRFPLLENHYGVFGGLEIYFWPYLGQTWGVFFGPMIQFGGLFPPDEASPLKEEYGLAVFGNFGFRIYAHRHVHITLGLGGGLWAPLKNRGKSGSFPIDLKLRTLTDIGYTF